jgi:hypothetical protein
MWALIISNEGNKKEEKKNLKSNWQVDVRLTETEFFFFPRKSIIDLMTVRRCGKKSSKRRNDAPRAFNYRYRFNREWKWRRNQPNCKWRWTIG